MSEIRVSPSAHRLESGFLAVSEEISKVLTLQQYLNEVYEAYPDNGPKSNPPAALMGHARRMVYQSEQLAGRPEAVALTLREAFYQGSLLGTRLVERSLLGYKLDDLDDYNLYAGYEQGRALATIGAVTDRNAIAHLGRAAYDRLTGPSRLQLEGWAAQLPRRSLVEASYFKAGAGFMLQAVETVRFGKPGFDRVMLFGGMAVNDWARLESLFAAEKTEE